VKNLDFSETVKLIVREDSRFEAGAYQFVREALEHTVNDCKKSRLTKARQGSHVSGPELLEGLKRHALQQYGPMARVVLDHWRVRSGADFGEIVFNLIDYGVFSKTDADKREDFANVLDFHDAFVRPYLPQFREFPALPGTGATGSSDAPHADASESPESSPMELPKEG
jgi:uncharacterized repeat protein (TIGR04138 family)